MVASGSADEVPDPEDGACFVLVLGCSSSASGCGSVVAGATVVGTAVEGASVADVAGGACSAEAAGG